MARYWLAKITDDYYFDYAVDNDIWLMQQQYNVQINSAVSNIWTTIIEIKQGDYLLLGYGNKIHAIGKVCNPKQIPVKHSTSNLSKSIKSNKHEYYTGYVVYDDNPVFYENFTDFDGEWGQRIDVEEWEYYSKDGISNYGIQEGSSGGLAILTIFEITEKYFTNKLDQLKTKYMETLNLLDKILNLLKSNKNLILTGAPGTGKTYLAKELAKKLILPSSTTGEISQTFIEPFLKETEDTDLLNKVHDAWHYWKNRILSKDFNLDDFANTISNVSNPDAIKYGFYLMNFLERTSADIYGSSKPGNAFNYGIKMNSDNKTYTIYDHKDEPVSKERAQLVFNEKIQPWLQELLKSTLSVKVKMVESGNELIRAGQLLRKIVILEHPQEFLTIYKDDTINRAYSNLVNGSANSYFEKNAAIINFLTNKYKLEKTIENQFRLTSYIWTYFHLVSSTVNDSIENSMSDLYIREHCEFVQFHPSFDYTDFVEGLRPIKKGDNELGFELKNGVFKQLCKKAVNDKTGANYVIIIDEINRAEISKVFGELFFAIDPGYRGTKGMVKTQYSNMQNEETCLISVDDLNFYVPENVYIIGTMNDIDRSVETFDFAMRRRFTWVEIKAEDRIGMLDETIPEWKVKAINKMRAINKAIEEIDGLNNSYHIGPAYFLKLEQYSGDFFKLWSFHIEPLVKEYLRGLPNSSDDLKKINDAYFNEPA